MMSVMRPETSEVTLTWCTAARSPTALSRFGTVSDLATAAVTLIGGGFMLAKNCAIILSRNMLNHTSPPTSSASRQPTIKNQSTGRVGRLRDFSSIGLPVSLGSVAMFMSCTLCRDRFNRWLRQFAVEMVGDGGIGEPDATEDEMAQLPVQVRAIVVGQAARGRKPRQRRHYHGMVGQPKQIKRSVGDPHSIACGHRPLERDRKSTRLNSSHSSISYAVFCLKIK